MKAQINKIKHHYYPQGLIRSWINPNTTHDQLVHQVIIKPKYGNHVISKYRATTQVMYHRDWNYTVNTEHYTSHDDYVLVNYVRRFEMAVKQSDNCMIHDTITVPTFLRLSYKLLCRQPTFNDCLIKANSVAFSKKPYLNVGVRHTPWASAPNTDEYRQWVRWNNAVAYLPTPYDISKTFNKFNYIFGVNTTSHHFILPDNIQSYMLVLSPKLVMKLLPHGMAHSDILNVVSVNDVSAINAHLISNCDSYYID